MGKLTATAVKAKLATPGTYQDGDGLFLKVDKRGGASWHLRLQRDGKRQDLGLGSAKLVSLADARDKASDLRKAIKIEKRDVLAERRDEAAAKVTFREAATLYHTENEGGWKSAIYARQWLASLENYAFPKLGGVTTGGVTTADIIAVLTPIWQEIPETARQVRNRICAVLDYAHAKGWRSTEAPSGNGSLKAGRGLPRQVKERENRKAMPYVAVPCFLTALRRKPSYGRLALELLILSGVRSQEVRLARWEEFDLDARLWTIPAEHMKRNKTHMVPLSDGALAVLAKAAALKLAGSEQVFPGTEGRPMSDMTLLKVLRDIQEPYHVHGFRSALTDWAANEGYPDAVVEAALAHKTPDAVQLDQAECLDHRRFAQFHDALRPGNGIGDEFADTFAVESCEAGFDDICVDRTELSKLMAVATRPTSNAEIECEVWLRGQFATDPEGLKRKPEFEADARKHFGKRVSVRGFSRVWAKVAPANGRDKPGRRKSNQNTK